MWWSTCDVYYHRSHKSCIAPRSWEFFLFFLHAPVVLEVSMTFWPSAAQPDLRISHIRWEYHTFFIVSCPIDFKTSTLTLLLFISLLLVFILFNKGLSRVRPLMPECLSSLIWRQLWPNNKTYCLLLKHIAWQTGEKKLERSASSPFIQSASLVSTTESTFSSILKPLASK